MTALTPELIERVRVLRASGLSLRQVAATIGCGYGTAQKAAGMPPPPPPLVKPPYYLHSPEPGCCSWPMSAGRPWRFCPNDKQAGSVYCRKHAAAAYNGRTAAFHAPPVAAGPYLDAPSQAASGHAEAILR